MVATWKDDYTENCTVELALIPGEGNQRVVNSGETIIEPGKLTLTVADEFQNKATGEINLTAIAVYGLENLTLLQLQVDQEADLLNGLTIAEGLTLKMVETVQDNARTPVDNPNAYTPEYPGSIDIILTLARPDGSTINVSSNNLTIKPMAFNKLTVTDIKPVDLLPVVGQVESGDKEVYDHIDHLRVAEATRIRDMMWQYGAGNHTPIQYQKYLSRLHT